MDDGRGEHTADLASRCLTQRTELQIDLNRAIRQGDGTRSEDTVCVQHVRAISLRPRPCVENFFQERVIGEVGLDTATCLNPRHRDGMNILQASSTYGHLLQRLTNTGAGNVENPYHKGNDDHQGTDFLELGQSLVLRQ